MGDIAKAVTQEKDLLQQGYFKAKCDRVTKTLEPKVRYSEGVVGAYLENKHKTERSPLL
jgi:hypothetical protein